MKKSISVERTYFLGDYKSLKIADHSEDIPEELMMNPEFMNTLRYLQLMEIEKAYYNYSIMSQSLRNESTDGERFVVLTEIVTNTFDKLLEIYKDTVDKE